MPNHRLKGFRMRSHRRRIDDGNKYAGIGDLARVTSNVADNSADGGTDLPRVVERMDEVGTDVFRRIPTTDGKYKDHVYAAQATSAQPIRVTGLPAVIVDPRGEFRHVIRSRVSFDLRDFAKVANRM